jgi:hypothetical protein
MSNISEATGEVERCKSALNEAKAWSGCHPIMLGWHQSKLEYAEAKLALMLLGAELADHVAGRVCTCGRHGDGRLLKEIASLKDTICNLEVVLDQWQ